MGRVLIDNVEVVMKLHKPVSVEELANQDVLGAGLLCEQLFFEEIKLLRRGLRRGACDSGSCLSFRAQTGE